MKGPFSAFDFDFVANTVELLGLPRDALRMVLVDGATEDEIARVLDVKPEHVPKLLATARRLVAAYIWPEPDVRRYETLLGWIANSQGGGGGHLTIGEDRYRSDEKAKSYQVVDGGSRIVTGYDLLHGEHDWRDASETEAQRAERKRKR